MLAGTNLNNCRNVNGLEGKGKLVEWLYDQSPLS